jgi:hypothetical protein
MENFAGMQNSRIFIALVLGAVLAPGVARADRRYFAASYTPYLAPAHEFEVEAWLTSGIGSQIPGPSANSEPRLEFEYAFTNRFTAAGYLNFKGPVDEFGEDLHFESPSLEFIYRLGDPGQRLGDAALYLEVTERRAESELEPKLLLAHHTGAWVFAGNLIGEVEFRHNRDELTAGGAVLQNAFAGEITSGAAYELGPRFSAGLEARYRAEFPNFGPRAAAVLNAGPSCSLEARHLELAVGILPQFWGSPQTSGHRNLIDFEKVEVRSVFAVEF